MVAVVDNDVRHAPAPEAMAADELELAERVDALELLLKAEGIRVGMLEEHVENLRSQNEMMRRAFSLFRQAGNLMSMVDVFLP